MAKNVSEPTGSSPVISLASPPLSRAPLATPSGEFRLARRTADVRRMQRKQSRTVKVQADIATQPDIASALLGSRGADVLPIAAFTGPNIEVTCDQWDIGVDKDLVWIRIHRADAEGHPEQPHIWDGLEENETYQLDSLGNPMILPFPVTALQAADNTDQFFALYVAQGSAFSDVYLSQSYHFEADRRAPGGDSLVHPVVDEDVITMGLTPTYLDAHGGKLDVTVDPYDDQQAGDVVVALMRVKGTSTPIETAPHTVAYDGEKFSVEFLKAALLAGGIDGRVEVWLRVSDIAGNTAESPAIEFETLLASAPSGFAPIEVPLHDTNGNLLTETEARQDPVFYVPGYANAATTDTVRVRILRADNTELLFERIPVTDKDADPIVSGNLSYAELDFIRSEYGGNPVFSFTMDYWIERSPFVIDTLQRTTINCDLTLPGGPDPDPTTPINENLKRPTISGDNIVDESEFGNPATVSIPFDDVNSAPVFLVDDEVQLFITDMTGANRTPVGTPVSITDPDTDLTTITVPANELVPGLMYFEYSITRAISGGTLTSTAWSPVQTVTVKSSDGLPGGGRPLRLEMSIFRDADQTRSDSSGLLRPSYQRSRTADTDNGLPTTYAGVLIRIHQYDNMALGDVIEVTLDGSHEYPNFTTAEPGLKWTFQHTVNEENMQERSTYIPEDDMDGTQPPLNEPGRFVDFKLAFQELFKLQNGQPGRGSMRVSYRITNAQGANTSDPNVVRFATVDVR